MPLSLTLLGARQLALIAYEEQPLAADEVRATAVLSAISHGTELSLFRGTSPFHRRRFDVERRLFVDGDETASYPLTPGYEWVGQVTEVGAGVTNFRPGELVHLPLPHRESHTFAPAALAQAGVTGPLPGALQPEQAIFLGSTSIALQAIHDARIKVGDHVVIFGMGTLGLLALQLARMSGAGRVDVVEPSASRRQKAAELGAHQTFDPDHEDVGLVLKQGHRGADVAIEFSGSYAALQQAIRCVDKGGLVVAAGFYQGPAHALDLGEEWLHNRVTMVASMRGWGNVHRDYPLWQRRRLRETAQSLLTDGHLKVDELIGLRLPFTEAQRAYERLDTGAMDLLKVVLDYDTDRPDAE